jgi:hypothetical protein
VYFYKKNKTLYKVYCSKPINEFPRASRIYTHPEPEPNKDEYGPQPNENDEKDEPIPQANETIELENYDPNYRYKKRLRYEDMFFDDDEVDNYQPNIIHIGGHHDSPDDDELDDEFEEFIEPEFNPELQIHNTPRYEINESDNELI